MNNQANSFILMLLILSIILLSCQESKTNLQSESDNTELKYEASKKKEKELRHVVIFKFNDDSSEEDVDRLNDAFNALPDAIPAIKDFEWGINESPENFHQDFTHCYILTFGSEEARDSIYTPHPDHQAFVASLQPHLEKVFVVDYWTNP